MRRDRSVICRFSGCDETAAATVGTLALCLLHKSYILDLMDRGVELTRENAPADDGSVISVEEIEI
jgi:hypothetical protein